MSQTKSNGTGNAKHSQMFASVSSSAQRKTKPSKRYRAIRGIAAAVLSCSVSAVSFAGDYKVPTLPIVKHAEEIPFTLYQGYLIVVEGRLGSLEHQSLLIDTGTSPSMIDRSVAVRLGLQGIRGDVSTFSKSVPADEVMLPEFQVGPLRRHNLNVMVADFTKLERSVGMHIAGIVGLDVLSSTSFTIDFGKRRIFFQPSHERHSVPFSVADQFLRVDLNTGKKQLHLLVDTGTPQLILFNRALRDLDYDWIAKNAVGNNLSGGGFYASVVLPDARLGPENVGPQHVTVVTTENEIDKGYDGLMGTSLLRPKRLSFDFERQILAWSN